MKTNLLQDFHICMSVPLTLNMTHGSNHQMSFLSVIALVLKRSSPANISTSIQRCFSVDMTSRRRTTPNQRWNNVAYANVEIYNIQQLWNKVKYFNVELNNVRQRRNNVVFNVDFHNVGQRRNNVAKPFQKKQKQISLNSKAK